MSDLKFSETGFVCISYQCFKSNRLLTTAAATLKSVAKSEAYLIFRICSKLWIKISQATVDGFRCRLLENDRLGESYRRQELEEVRTHVVGPVCSERRRLLGPGGGATMYERCWDLSEIEELGKSFETSTHTLNFVEK